jgi:uncharacterized protein YjbI with pentapeptide repeats
MPEYFLDVEYNNHTYGVDEINFKEFECCTFNHCTFSACNFMDVTFIDCVFNDCIFNEARINHVALRTVTFNRCEIKDVNFAMCNKLIFEVHFDNCTLDFSKFYTLKIKGTNFINCSLIAVDFMAADLTEVFFENCDLYRAEFNKATANKTNFKSSYNYTIDPKTTKLKKAVFALEGLKGLLYKHDIVVK